MLRFKKEKLPFRSVGSQSICWHVGDGVGVGVGVGVVYVVDQLSGILPLETSRSGSLTLKKMQIMCKQHENNRAT